MQFKEQIERVALLFSRGFSVDFADEECFLMSRSRENELVDYTVSVMFEPGQEFSLPSIEIRDHKIRDTEKGEWDVLEYSLKKEDPVATVECGPMMPNGVFFFKVIKLNS